MSCTKHGCHHAWRLVIVYLPLQWDQSHGPDVQTSHRPIPILGWTTNLSRCQVCLLYQPYVSPCNLEMHNDSQKQEDKFIEAFCSPIIATFVQKLKKKWRKWLTTSWDSRLRISGSEPWNQLSRSHKPCNFEGGVTSNNFLVIGLILSSLLSMLIIHDLARNICSAGHLRNENMLKWTNLGKIYDSKGKLCARYYLVYWVHWDHLSHISDIDGMKWIFRPSL